VIALVLAVAGSAAIVVAVRAQRSAPRPSAAAAGQLIVTTTTAAHPSIPRAPREPPTTPRMPASPPTSITIPSIGVTSDLTSLGLNPDGSVEVPVSFQTAGWYRGSVTPGQVGPTVILGHIDSTAGPGVFYEVGALQPGAQVIVNRRDGRVVTFKITGVREYPKDHFPTIDVYGNTSIPTIRLITCGGAFDSTTHHYLSNIVAFGQLA
jgi:hypothetical protein